jgi:hypothetical protein
MGIGTLLAESCGAGPLKCFFLHLCSGGSTSRRFGGKKDWLRYDYARIDDCQLSTNSFAGDTAALTLMIVSSHNSWKLHLNSSIVFGVLRN